MWIVECGRKRLKEDCWTGSEGLQLEKGGEKIKRPEHIRDLLSSTDFNYFVGAITQTSGKLSAAEIPSLSLSLSRHGR